MVKHMNHKNEIVTYSTKVNDNRLYIPRGLAGHYPPKARVNMVYIESLDLLIVSKSNLDGLKSTLRVVDEFTDDGIDVQIVGPEQ